MGCGQHIKEIKVKPSTEINWHTDGIYRICHGTSGRVKGIRHDELLLEHWDEGSVGGGTVTYYRLPRIIHRIYKMAFENGEESAKQKIKTALGI